MQLISKPPTDKLTFSIMQELTSNVLAYYVWAMHMDRLPATFPDGIVVLVIKDVLTSQQIEQLSALQPNKFVLVTSLEGLQLENMQIVHMGGDWLNQIEEYQSLEPMLEKSFNSSIHVINLNRNTRHHRTIAASYLLGTNVPANVTYMTKSASSFLDAVPWDIPANVLSPLVNGYTKLVPDNPDIYLDVGNVNNIANFKNRLASMYSKSFVEVVSETTFDGPMLFTEKTMHSFLACNFPILLAPTGTVQFLRELGFDMFDDIINNEHDLEKDQVQRILKAIDNNYELLHNADLAKQLWKQNMHRFEKNWNIVASGQLASWYEKRLRTEFAAAIKELTQIKS